MDAIALAELERRSSGIKLSGHGGEGCKVTGQGSRSGTPGTVLTMENAAALLKRLIRWKENDSSTGQLLKAEDLTEDPTSHRRSRRTSAGISAPTSRSGASCGRTVRWTGQRSSR